MLMTNEQIINNVFIRMSEAHTHSQHCFSLALILSLEKAKEKILIHFSRSGFGSVLAFYIEA